MELPNILSNVKKSDSNSFTHFSKDRVWASEFEGIKGYNVQNMELASFLNYRADTEGSTFVYATRRLLHAYTNPIIQELAPCINNLPSTPGVESEISIWLTSGNTIATPHYDMEHNFFLQLNGTKRFVIASPTHYPLFRLYSSLHPRWRQGQARNLTSNEALNEVLTNPSICDGYSQRSSACPVTSINELWSTCSSAKDETASSNNIQKIAPAIHVIDLHPGQMLYIPPFFFHAVTTLDPYSVSINSWFGSKYLTAANKLSTSVPLPFAAGSTETSRILTIGALINLVVARLGKWVTPGEFARMLQSRVAADIPNISDVERYQRSVACNLTLPFSACNDRSIATEGR